MFNCKCDLQRRTSGNNFKSKCNNYHWNIYIAIIFLWNVHSIVLSTRTECTTGIIMIVGDIFPAISWIITRFWIRRHSWILCVWIFMDEARYVISPNISQHLCLVPSWSVHFLHSFHRSYFDWISQFCDVLFKSTRIMIIDTVTLLQLSSFPIWYFPISTYLRLLAWYD